MYIRKQYHINYFPQCLLICNTLHALALIIVCFKYFDFFPRYTLICSQTHVPMFDRLIVDHLSKQKCAHKKTNEEIIYIPSYTAGGSFFVATIRTLHNLELESK